MEHIKELWLPVEGFPNYEVSNWGNVRNRLTGKMLKQPISNTGYKRVYLYDDQGSHPKSVHRIEAEAFFDGCGEHLQVNHIDGNKQNNDLSNLEWCTASENMKHAFKTGLEKRGDYQTKRIKEAVNRRHRPIRCVENGKIYTDYVEASIDLGCHKSAIWHVMNGDQKQTKGFHFEWVDE